VNGEAARHLRWWAFYVFLQVAAHVVLSSIGAFFHFLLGHGIGLVEGWLHNGAWELALASKAIGLWGTHRLLRVRMYRATGLVAGLREGARWPSERAWVVGVFIIAMLLFWGGPEAVPDNRGHLWAQFTAFGGITLWLLADVVIAGVLQELFPFAEKSRLRLPAYLVGFALAFRLAFPDYFGTALLMHLHFLTVMILAGPSARRWTESAAYLLLAAAPAAAWLGLDPLWGADFSPWRLARAPAAPFLLAIWMLSWAYYSLRHRWREFLPRR
jgi:hypothetical protein